MRQTAYRRRLRIESDRIASNIEQATQAELAWLFRQLQLKIRRINQNRPKVRGQRPKLQKAYIVPGDLWEQFRFRMQKTLLKELMEGAITLAALKAAFYEGFGHVIQFDFDELARQIQPELGQRIVHTELSIKREVGRKIVAWYNTPGMSMEALVRQLQTGTSFSRGRASNIAQTELTTLNSRIEQNIGNQLGLDEWWWSTRRDQIVCKQLLSGPDGRGYKGCRELHGKVFKRGMPMPPEGSHIGCRCSSIWVVPNKNASVQPALPTFEELLAIRKAEFSRDLHKAEWKEEEHPRKKDGEFAPKGEGGGGSGAEQEHYSFKEEKPQAKPLPKYKIKFRDWGSAADANVQDEIAINTNTWKELRPPTKQYVVSHELIHQTVENGMMEEYKKNPDYMDEVADMLTLAVNSRGDRIFLGGNTRLNEAVADTMAAHINGENMPKEKEGVAAWVDETIKRFGYDKDALRDHAKETVKDINSQLGIGNHPDIEVK